MGEVDRCPIRESDRTIVHDPTMQHLFLIIPHWFPIDLFSDQVFMSRENLNVFLILISQHVNYTTHFEVDDPLFNFFAHPVAFFIQQRGQYLQGQDIMHSLKH